MSKRPCRYCESEVTSTRLEVDFCRDCFYEGRTLNELFSQLIADIQRPAYWMHTGGGCFALEIPLGEHYLWATADQDGSAPDDETGPWWLFRYDGMEDDGGDLIAAGLTRWELLYEIDKEARR